MNTKQDSDFQEFVLDHIEHFNTIPLEYEDALGRFYSMEECWDWADRLGLIELIQTNRRLI